MLKNSVLLNAAIAGLLSAAPAFAADKGAEKSADHTAPAATATTAEAKGKCIGATTKKGESKCATADSSCAGENTCKGKGFLETSKAECEKLMKKNKKIKFEG